MLIGRARRLARLAYAVPWCVPQWGWREAAATVVGTVTPGDGASAADFAVAVREVLNVPFALPVGLGRMAIELGLRAMEIGPGDDVVLPSYVCTSVLQAVQHVKAHPVFADVGPSLNVTLETVLAALTPRTRCVIVPHLFGASAPIASIERALRERGIGLMDDAAQGLGAVDEGRPVGSFGACWIVSVGPGKPLAGSGGGVLVTSDRGLFERAAAVAPAGEVGSGLGRVWGFWVRRRLRRYSLPVQVLAHRLMRKTHPPDDGESDYILGGMSGIEARIGMAQLRRLGATIVARRRNAALLLAAMGSLSAYNVVDTKAATASMKLALVLPEGGPSVEETIEAFADGGVECQQGYTPCHHRVPGTDSRVPYTEFVWRRVLCVPLETSLPRPDRLAAGLTRIAPRTLGGTQASLVVGV